MGTIVRNGICYSSGGGNEVELTQAEYDALPDSKLTDGVNYFITDAIIESCINDAATSTESTWSSSKIDTEIDKANTVAVSDTEPTNENVVVWIKRNNSSPINLPEIDDASVSEVDTWSSKKINEELAAIRASITGILEGSF